ncbi:MAG: hypothetical protein A3J74_07575 [Elusimicrobia bacterium RIFCSPHIGHO2_02_FULL_57_9]|nr:MAG: hypothetical protein A3J74_07575 [Elusimicrobia bacterium RIFCSPHIGHO2_02_FULL_57_9]
MILGIHCALGRGFDAALQEAVSLGCQVMQMLPYRRHHDPDDGELARFKQKFSRSPLARLLIHSRFVPSLASSDPLRRGRSAALLSRELVLASKLGASAFILHAGAYSPGGNLTEGIGLAVESIIRSYDRSQSLVPLYLENVPGGGRRIGGKLEELADMLESLDRRLPQTAVCLDTAHAWACGYEIASAEGMMGFLAKAKRLLGAWRVRAFHLNDTRALLGSHREHHGHWGQGHLGREGLKVLLESPQYQQSIGILETPKEEGWDRKNLEYIRAL